MRSVTGGFGLRHRQKNQLRKRFLLGCLLPGFFGVVMLASKAEAARLNYWRFDAARNQLEFTTEGGVQPKAQLIFNPTRLVIDLPGTTIGRTARAQEIGGAVRVIRVGQLDAQTSRIVVELAEGYTIDPQQVRFQGASASQWTVEIPTPQLIGQTYQNVGAAAQESRSQDAASVYRGAANQLTTIKAIEFDGSGNQLLIKADAGITFTGEWDQATAAYRITIPAAKVTNQLRTPILDRNRNLLWLRVEQEEPQTVAILIQPASGVQITEVNQPSAEMLSIQMQRQQGAVVPPQNTYTSNINPTAYYPTAPQPSYPAPMPSNGRVVVVIDPGHGGRDPGAIGIGGLREKDVVLDISLQVSSILEQQGVQVVMTRTDDREIDLEPRVQLAERVNATLFVSIHANAINMSRSDVNGVETYYYSSGLGLARAIHNSMLQYTGARDRRVRQANFYVLRRTSMPAVLVEVGFVTGAEDAARLADPAFRTLMAQAIAYGIMQYLQQRR
ncbi:MAG: N-acetylmuramoyl-L-alanine amidase [Oscillatoriaceae bacterium SKW80]|nr:N-acetylmuramoyl-L-alanine amidase [Oscillatoriaceae bacterium SKYG93]MCX8122407.1 N-acetylmuramoyl-L-alanine amidase [Oscillatoriaceae bacterium SKW80]MDW8452668.1 N-acetylmuramoyl-L-alanine amidase [Oscillatoriaceae cyanobacterium SKYGB_i_bin93]HIK28007.1 N-acetylmuramoyl-L-alanine amidase [Oscillatoriaceae cyanobacterium M7585_C2015_266]